MTPEQKLLALRALGGPDTGLHIRGEGDWYVRVPRTEIKDGSVLRSTCGNGATPDEAIEDCWRSVATGAEIVVDAMRDTRRSCRWNGFMWEPIPSQPSEHSS